MPDPDGRNLGSRQAHRVLRQSLWVEAAIALGASTAFVAYYVFATTNYGGCSYSIRYFVSFIPLLWFFAFPVFLEWHGWRRLVLAALFAMSFCPAVFGCVNPWPCGRGAFLINVTRWHDDAAYALRAIRR